MASTSRSKGRRRPKVKQIWQVKQPKRNWLELPTDVTANILHRVGAIDIIENVQKVCTSWRSICKDPAMWRVIDMANHGDLFSMPYELEYMCKHAVDRSQGQLIDINIEYFGSIHLLHYIADRSSQLKRLHLACLYGSVYEILSEVLRKLPLLEELTLCLTDIAKKDIETCGSCCPLLKSLKINKQGFRHRRMDYDEAARIAFNEEAVAIGKNLPELRHLQLIGNSMSNIGLQAILDGCPHLESLDLRRCPNITLSGDLGKRCLEQIKCVRLPDDSLEDYKFDAEIYDDKSIGDISDLDKSSDDDGHAYDWYEYNVYYDDWDDFSAYNCLANFENLNVWNEFEHVVGTYDLYDEGSSHYAW